ncbi:hypothetical protein BDN70DRAFT_874306 [Pholiota conissans]|uniref:Uncharacterized protein n=1 Tax=Pholiota conissans TaxID=109636 RepID=A0A9P5ZA69_9AGAR|nr:hypothetical protein BDN70DRAFT_874306 [Pholiota conissans]
MVESPLLPLDIADNIIEALTLCDPDLTTVKACSLVCHDFLYICRKHIFASITLNPFPAAPLSRNFGWTQKGPTQKFKQLLLDAPQLADYVQELDYTYESQDLNNAAELCQLFAKFTRLKYLVIAAAYGLWWNTSPLRPAFLRLFHLPTLVGLEVSAMNGFIVTDLAPCVNLKRSR